VRSMGKDGDFALIVGRGVPRRSDAFGAETLVTLRSADSVTDLLRLRYRIGPQGYLRSFRALVDEDQPLCASRL
jgi:hypothetical protein